MMPSGFVPAVEPDAPGYPLLERLCQETGGMNHLAGVASTPV